MVFNRIATSLLALSTALVSPFALSQVEGPQPTQALLAIASKDGSTVMPADLTVDVNGKSRDVTALTLLRPSDIQIAILIDDGLRSSVGRQLEDIRQFIQTLPAGTEVLVGSMQNGRVVPAQPFTSNLAAAASQLRIPMGTLGVDASPYFCLSDFAKRWPTEAAYGAASNPGRKARFVLMLTSGVDPYNGSVSPMNQDSPYVQASITDAQRAGISVSAIYYGQVGIRGGAANFSGQSYLSQVAEGTGGYSYYQGRGNPVTLAPYLKNFESDIAQTYVANFLAPSVKDVVSFRVKTKAKGLKIRAASAVRPGILLVSSGQ